MESVKREIKFRIPHYSYDGKFVCFSYWGRLKDCEFASPAMINTGPVKKPDEQYTGLKDKNGKEIYEGDTLNPDNMTVVWVAEIASFGLMAKGWMYTHFFEEAIKSDDCEIIGNIHEDKS
jgi:hypothetical protein